VEPPALPGFEMDGMPGKIRFQTAGISGLCGRKLACPPLTFLSRKPAQAIQKIRAFG
jgi:hypothetical protein